MLRDGNAFEWLYFSAGRLSIIFSMIYWIGSIAIPYLVLENPLGHGYFLHSRVSKVITSLSPGMGLHWAFRVIERFERFRESPWVLESESLTLFLKMCETAGGGTGDEGGWERGG